MIKVKLSQAQVIETIVEDLARAGILHPCNTGRYVATLKSYDETTLLKTLIHAHELRETRTAFEEMEKGMQESKERIWRNIKGRLFGKLTGMLRPAHISKGYSLVEDEDYLYLYLPNPEMPPIVFNARTTELPDVIKTICRLEGEDA